MGELRGGGSFLVNNPLSIESIERKEKHPKAEKLVVSYAVGSIVTSSSNKLALTAYHYEIRGILL